MTKRLKPLTPEEMAQHVRDLASAFQVPLVEDPKMKREEGISLHTAVKQQMVSSMVVVHPIVDDVSYAIALHELGHCLAPLGVMPGRDDVSLVKEEAAWEWAEYYSLDWTVAMEQTKVIGIDSYRRRFVQQKLESEKRSAGLKSFLKKVL